MCVLRSPRLPFLFTLTGSLFLFSPTVDGQGFQFQSQTSPFPAGIGADGVAAADFDGDGDLDLAAGNRYTGANTNNRLVIWDNDGGGRMAIRLALPLLGQPTDVVAADFNGDGAPDLAVANFTPGNSVSIFLNDGSGGYPSRVTVPVLAIPTGLGIGDVDSDGSPDLAVTLRSVADRHVGVLINDGSGGFTSDFARYPVGLGPSAVDLGDLDGDGSLDLAVTCDQGDVVSVLLNAGDGTYAASVSYPSGSSPSAIEIGDMDRDGFADLVVANRQSGYVSLYLNDGSGAFATRLIFPSELNGNCLSLADMDADGDLDVALGVGFTTHVSLFDNNGFGSLTPAGVVSSGYEPFAVTAADFDGNGSIDLAAVNNGLGGEASLSMLLNETPFHGAINLYGLGLRGSNIGTLNSSSAPSEGTQVDFRVSGFTGGTRGLLILSLRPAELASFGGTQLVQFPPALIQAYSLSSGAASIPLSIPLGTSGITAYLQAGAFVATQPFGIGLTNGVRMDVGN